MGWRTGGRGNGVFFFSFLMPLDFGAQRAHASSWYACSVECCKACYNCRNTLGEGEVVVEIAEIFICGEEKCINRQQGDGEGVSAKGLL